MDIPTSLISLNGPNQILIKHYLLQLVLYEAVEVPNFGSEKNFYAIVVTCGPYEKSSSIKQAEDSRV